MYSRIGYSIGTVRYTYLIHICHMHIILFIFLNIRHISYYYYINTNRIVENTSKLIEKNII